MKKMTGKILALGLGIPFLGVASPSSIPDATVLTPIASPVRIRVSTNAVAKRRAITAQPYTWHNVTIVGGGFITGILFSPKQPDLVYARTDIGGAYRWDPATKRWIPLLDWLEGKDWNLYGIESVGVDPTDARRVYLATGTYSNSWGGNGAILRSMDQGRTWKRTDMPFKMGGNEDGRSIGERLAVDPNQNSTLYFGSRHNGLWKSTDYAATWNKVESFPVKERTNGIGIGFVVFDPRSGSTDAPTPTLYIGVAAPGVNLYRSRDGGTTWEAVPGQPAGLLPHHGVLASDGMLYLSYGDGPGPNGMSNGAVWKLNTKTGDWTNITPFTPGTADNGKFGYAGLTVDALHPQTVMVATMDRWSVGDDVFRSTDGGAHWMSMKAKAIRDSSASPFLNWGAKSAAFGHWIGDVKIDPFHPNHVLYVTGATLWGTDDATAADQDAPTHWTVRAQGLEETAVIDLISPSSGAHLVSALGDIGGFCHTDFAVSPSGGMWTNPMMSNTDSLDFAANAPTSIVRVGRADARSRRGALSTDGGETWTPFGTEPPGSQGSGSVAIAADGSTILWAPRDSMPYRSTDHGATWTLCAGAPAGPRVVADRVNPARFYLLADNSNQVYASTDAGASFSVATQSLPKDHGVLRALPGVEGNLWFANKAGLYRSIDGGANFQKLDSVEQANSLGFGKAAPNHDTPALFLLGMVNRVDGIFRSDDAGATWVQIDDKQHRFATRGTIIGDPRLYGRVYVGTNGRGILYGDVTR